VVNVILREDIDGDNISATIGTTTEGGGDSWELQWAGGKSGPNWSLTYAFEHLHQDPIFGIERDKIATTRNAPVATPRPALSLVIIDAVGAVVNPGFAVLYPGADVCDSFGYDTATSPTRGTYCGSFNDPAYQSIRNEAKNTSGYVRGTWDFDNGMRLWASASVWDSEAIGSSGTEFYGNTLDPFAGFFYEPNLGTIVQLQRIFNPFEYGSLEAVSTQFDEQAAEFAAGLQGTFSDRFDWEFTVAQSSYDYKANRPRFLAQRISNWFLTEVPGELDPFFGAYPVFELDLERWHTPFTPQQYAEMSTRVINEGDSKAQTANFVVTGDLFDMPAGPLSFATILEWGHQEYDLNADPRILPGNPLGPDTILNLTGTGGGGERDRYAFGIELSAPLHDTLNATLAGRYDKYDDITRVDDAVTYMAGLEWRPFDSLLVRGSYSTSFRAPDMHYVFAEQSGSFSSILDEYSCRSGTGPAAALGPRTVAECNTSGDPTIYQTFGLRAGNPFLEEEEGKSYTVGFVWDILDNMSFSVDYWNIELENQVGDISLAYILQQEANCRLGVNRDGSPFEFSLDSQFCQDVINRIERQNVPGSALDQRIVELTRGPINRAFRAVDGIDANWRWRVDTGDTGEFAFEVFYTHTLGQEFAEFGDQTPRDYRDDLNNYDYRSRVRGSVMWSYEDWQTTLYGQRYGSIPNWAETARLGPYITYNFSVYRRINEHLRLGFIANKVLNKMGLEDETHTSWPYFNHFVGQTPYGREVFLQVDYTF